MAHASTQCRYFFPNNFNTLLISYADVVQIHCFAYNTCSFFNCATFSSIAVLFPMFVKQTLQIIAHSMLLSPFYLLVLTVEISCSSALSASIDNFYKQEKVSK